MKTLASNQDLYEYLQWLSSELKGRGATGLGDEVARASGQASALSTEFLGEARIALRTVERQAGSVLSPPERADVLDVLGQLDTALDRR
jgi:hypothetical protein